MRAAVFCGPEKVEVRDVPIPVAKAGEILIKVAYAGVCGSDLQVYMGKHPRAKAPVIMGHEFSGTVAAIGPDTGTDLRPGEAVAVNPLLACGTCPACLGGFANACRRAGFLGIDAPGAFAEYAVVAASRAYRLPEGVTLREGALVEPLAVAVRAVRNSRLRVGDLAVVIGGGPIGFLTALVARLAGGRVVLSEVSESRLEAARRAGLQTIDARHEDPVETVLSMTERQGAEVVFDAAAVRASADQAVRMVAPEGEIVVVGVFKEPVPVDLLKVNYLELRLEGSRAYSDKDFRVAISLIAEKSIPTDLVISHSMSLDEVETALRLARRGEGAMKILIEPVGA
jgi:2-desacetyl-2-hydroxyethyl bacteriochlorophyllide A dehydrogenase